jgi:hypothetical protein
MDGLDIVNSLRHTSVSLERIKILKQLWQTVIIGIIFTVLFAHFMDLKLLSAATGS